VSEEAARVDLVAQVPDRVRVGRRAGDCFLVVRNNRLVVLLHLGEERVAVGRQHMLRCDDGERTTFAKQRRRLLVAQAGVDPMKGRKGDDGVELRVRRPPGSCARAIRSSKTCSG
jgi:hypothetical protein